MDKKMHSKQPRRKYDEGFKTEALQMVTAGRSAADVARSLGIGENLLLDRPAPQAPNEVFIGDITYIPLCQGTFLYLACWQDMFSRKIVGWELADNMRRPN